MQQAAASFHAQVAFVMSFVIFVPLCPLYMNHIRSQHRHHRVDPVWLYGKHQQLEQQHNGYGKGAIQGSQTATAELLLPNVTLKYFPQAKRCKADWVQKYATLHHNVVRGTTEPRYLVSVTAGTGLADKLVGTMTLLWNAVLTHRALSVITYPGDPGLSDVCQAGWFDWTQTPAVVKQDAIELLRPSNLLGSRDNVAVTLPNTYDRSTFQALQLHNKRAEYYEKLGNTSSLLDPAYLLVTYNRGQTHALAADHYKQRFQAMGVPATDAFMCGFFFFCSPVAAVQQYYQHYWDILSEPGVLRIGIQIRSGDMVMEKEANSTVQQQAPQDILKGRAHFFKCAERLEAAFATPGQKVVWFLNSDSQAVRQAAKAVYGDKLLTDVSLKATHPQCGVSHQNCQKDQLKRALQHSMGSILTFSLTDVQVISRSSGFGRTGAWLADSRDRIFEMSINGDNWASMCIPQRPTSHVESSGRWSGI